MILSVIFLENDDYVTFGDPESVLLKVNYGRHSQIARSSKAPLQAYIEESEVKTLFRWTGGNWWLYRPWRPDVLGISSGPIYSGESADLSRKIEEIINDSSNRKSSSIRKNDSTLVPEEDYDF